MASENGVQKGGWGGGKGEWLAKNTSKNGIIKWRPKREVQRGGSTNRVQKLCQKRGVKK